MAGVLGKVFITPCGIWSKDKAYKDLSLVSVKTGSITVAYLSDGDIVANTEITNTKWVKWFEVEDGVDGAKGATGAKGADGAKGNPFTYQDFTPEQLESLKVKGDPGTTGSKGDKGAKGDPFTYADFTSEQLNALKVKGDKGDKGDTGTNGAKGDKGDKGSNGTNGNSIVSISFTKDADGLITGGTATMSDSTTIAITIA